MQTHIDGTRIGLGIANILLSEFWESENYKGIVHTHIDGDFDSKAVSSGGYTHS